jgi:hypothetical protein
MLKTMLIRTTIHITLRQNNTIHTNGLIFKSNPFSSFFVLITVFVAPAQHPCNARLNQQQTLQPALAQSRLKFRAAIKFRKAHVSA